MLSLLGLVLFRKTITARPVSFTLFWVTIAGVLLSLPTIGLFYGVNEWLGVSPRAFAVIDTTISAPLGQLSMVPMLALIAKTAPEGAEATTFAIMASLMNLALSASELFTGYLNAAFAVTQADYANLGRLMIAVAVIGLVPLLALPLLIRGDAVDGPVHRRESRAAAWAHALLCSGRADMVTPARRSWDAILRLLERDERVFAVLLAFVLVGGLATLGLDPFQPSRQVNIYALVVWFAAYKAGVFALVTVQPRATRAIFIGALGVDLLLVFFLLYLTGGAYSLFYLLFFPLVAVNAFYFGPWVGLLLALVAGLLYAAAAALASLGGLDPGDHADAADGAAGVRPRAGRRPRAPRAQRGRAAQRRVSGTLTRLQAAQEKLVEAERMAMVGRLSLKVAHEVRNPIAAIELNAELLGDIVQEGRGPRRRKRRASSAPSASRWARSTRSPRSIWRSRASPRRSSRRTRSTTWSWRSPTSSARLAARQGITVSVATDPTIPPMEIDRSLLRQAVLNLIKNGLEALSQGGASTVTTRRLDDSVEVSISDTGPGISPDVGRRLFEQFFTTKPQGTGLGLSITRQIVEEHGGSIRWTSTPGAGATFTITLPIKGTEHV